MADSLALAITVPHGRLAAFVAGVGAQLEPDTPWSEAALAELAARGGELALTFRFAPDAALAAFHAEHPDIRCSVPGEVAVGHVYATARAAREGLEIGFFTSSRAIVRVLKESWVVRAFFRRLGRLGAPAEVRITDEWNEVSVLPDGPP